MHLGVLVATAIVFALLGAPLAAASWREARHRRLTIEAMFVLAIGGALGASLVAMLRGEGAVYFEVAAILLVVYSLGQQLGRTAQRRAIEAAEAWQRELASCQLVETDGRVRAVPVAELQAGQVVEVQPGRLIPADGEVVAGEAFVREATLTGEHFAVVRRRGDRVWAGTHAVDGLLRVRATSTGTSRRIDAILAAVEHARATPGHLQRQADRFIAVFLPVVVAISVLTGVGWGLARGWTVGLFNAMAVLLVACPCALGLATPLAVWRALGALARRGLVPHSADAVERLAAARTVVLDKTGTITESASCLADLVVCPDTDAFLHRAARPAGEARGRQPPPPCRGVRRARRRGDFPLAARAGAGAAGGRVWRPRWWTSKAAAWRSPWAPLPACVRMVSWGPPGRRFGSACIRASGARRWWCSWTVG